jgi:hypothetical protein
MSQQPNVIAKIAVRGLYVGKQSLKIKNGLTINK